jgi:hypothetical protein
MPCSEKYENVKIKENVLNFKIQEAFSDTHEI